MTIQKKKREQQAARRKAQEFNLHELGEQSSFLSDE